MKLSWALPLLVLAITAEAERSPRGGAGKKQKGKVDLRSHLKDDMKAEADRLARIHGHAADLRLWEETTTRPKWMAPTDPTLDRLRDDACKEPKPYKKTDYAGAFGPDKIYCCHTVRQVIEDVNYRCTVDCNDAHPCHGSMKETYCPKYLAAYHKMEAVLCKARPTTTTTTITTMTTTTIPVCLDGEHSPVYPCRCGDDGKLCQDNEICDHETGTCKHKIPDCPADQQIPESYPCVCGEGEHATECKEPEVCLDPVKGVCGIPEKSDDPLKWCSDLCISTVKEQITVEGEEGALCEAAEEEAREGVEPGCVDFCKKLHGEGALRAQGEFKKPALLEVVAHHVAAA